MRTFYTTDYFSPLFGNIMCLMLGNNVFKLLFYDED